MTHYRLIQPEDLQSVFALDLRKADVEEIKASVGLDPAGALFFSVNVSERVWVVEHQGSIEAVFGVSRSGSWGIPWFVATDKLNEFRYTFAKESKKVVKGLLEEYEVLANFVDSRHAESIRWLKWLGFEVMTSAGLPLHDPNTDF